MNMSSERSVNGLRPVLLAAFGFAIFATNSSLEAQSSSDNQPITATVQIDSNKILRTMEPRMLGSTNAAFWTGPAYFNSPVINQFMKELNAGMVRMPGGSYADHIYWNGHGVRGPDGKVDPTRMKDGYPDVNYADGIYEPSFTAARQTHEPGQSKAMNVDVKTMHDFIKAVPGLGTMAIANAGTGRAVDAAEWARWANQKMGYDVRYWEIGNELDGDWEPGHIMPDGTHMTGEVYAERYRDFAKAIKAIDPTLKVGGAAGGTGENSFNHNMLRIAGDYVDFVSIHNYYATRLNTIDEGFDNLVKATVKEVDLAKKWIKECQPQRADKIEIIYSEWNLTNQPGEFCSDMYSALWASWFLALAANNGVHAATQWDLFTAGEGPGFAMIHKDGSNFVRKSQYYAFQLWNNYMGRQLLSTNLSGNSRVKALSSRNEDDLYVMILNIDRDKDAEVKLDLSGFEVAPAGEKASLTSREYFWPPKGKKPFWSEGIRIEPIRAANSFNVKVPPFSICYLHLAKNGSDSAKKLSAMKASEPKSPGKPELRFFIDKEMFSGDKVEGCLVATLAGTEKPYPVALPDAILSASDSANFDRKSVRLSESAGHFSIRPENPGELKITATCQDASVSTVIKVKPSIPRPSIYWDFRNPTATDEKTFSSDWKLVNDEGIRPNKGVARVDFPAEGSLPGGSKAPRAALVVKNLPQKNILNRADVRGAIFDIMLSSDFQTDDPNASLQVVMQTPLHGYWMPIGNIKFKDIKDGKWHTQQITVTDEKMINAMEGIYNIWFVVGSGKPVKGSVFFDQIGLMVR